jgi:hypothetical protein
VKTSILTPAEILRMLYKAYGKAAMRERHFEEWHTRLRYGRASVTEDSGCRRPSTSTDKENIEHVLGDQ